MSKVLPKMDWKTGGLIIAGGACLIVGGVLIMQWRHACVGRKVGKTVLKFLEMHGAKLKHGIISGGPVEAPMPLDAAIVNTVHLMIDDENQMAIGHGGTVTAVTDADADDNQTAPVPVPAPKQVQKVRAAGAPKVRKAKAPKVSSNPTDFDEPEDEGGYAGPAPKKINVSYNPDQFVRKGERPPEPQPEKVGTVGARIVTEEIGAGDMPGVDD